MKGKHTNDTVSKQRTYCVSVRFSAQEKEELDAARGRTAAGRFLREAFLQRKTIIVPECNRQAWSELSDPRPTSTKSRTTSTSPAWLRTS